MAWDLEEVRDLTTPKAKGKTWIDRLLATGTLAPSFACELSAELEDRGSDHVGTLFQLPYPVVLPSGWHQLVSSPESGTAYLKFELADLSMDEFGRCQLRPLGSESDRSSRGLTVSQGFAVFHTWGRHQRAHERYLANLDQLERDPVIVSQRDSWVDNRPIKASGYEADFGARLQKDVGFLLQKILPAYGLVSRSETPVLRWVYGCVPMLAPGRMVDVRAKPLATYWFEGPSVEPPGPIAMADLVGALRIANRELGAFELQLMAMERLRREGELALALIGTAALVEWFLHSASRGISKKQRSLAELLKSDRLPFLSDPLRMMIDEIRGARNALVHGAPPVRELAHLPAEPRVGGRELEPDVSR